MVDEAVVFIVHIRQGTLALDIIAWILFLGMGHDEGALDFTGLKKV